MIVAHELLEHARGRAFIADTGTAPCTNSAISSKCFFHSLKRYRAIATRYDKTARNYLALVQLACARIWLEN